MGVRVYDEGLGAVPPVGSRGRAPGQWVRGRSPHEAERLLTFRHPMAVANMPYSLL